MKAYSKWASIPPDPAVAMSDEETLARTSEVCSQVGFLSDLAIAVLLGLVASSHVLIQAPVPAPALAAPPTDAAGPELFARLERELRLVLDQVFSREAAAIDCSQLSSLADFENQLARLKRDVRRSFQSNDGSSVFDRVGELTIGSTLLLSSLDEASEDVQAALAELLLTGRFSTRNGGTVSAPPGFLLVATVAERQKAAEGRPRLVAFLADRFPFSHLFDPSEGFPLTRLQLQVKNPIDHSPTADELDEGMPPISPADISALHTFAHKHVRISDEIRGYMQDLVVFLRAHPAVATPDGHLPGVSAAGARMLSTIVTALATIQNYPYAPPEIVKLAFFKVFEHRIGTVKAGQERERLWTYLDSHNGTYDHSEKTAQDILEDVFFTVRAPI